MERLPVVLLAVLLVVPRLVVQPMERALLRVVARVLS